MRKLFIVLLILLSPTLVFAAPCASSAYTCDQVETLLDTVDGGVLSAVVEDTNPILGGPLDLSGNYIYSDFASFVDTDTDPDVFAGKNFKTANTEATTIADFDAGLGSLEEGQEIYVLINDSFTTIEFSNVNLSGHNEVDWAPGVGDSMNCTHNADGVWNCIVSRPSSFTGVAISNLDANRVAYGDASGILATSDNSAAVFHTTGVISHSIETSTYAANQVLSGAETHSGTVYVTAPALITLPSISDGAAVSVITIGATAVTIAPNAVDKIWLDGTALHDGDTIDNKEAAGDQADCTYYSADGWYCRTISVTSAFRWVDGGAPAVGTDFIDDANAMFAAYMNSAGDAAEVDVSGENNNLAESAGDTIAQSADVPAGYSGNSKDFESTETEYLEQANNLATDISGANQSITYAAWIKAEDDTGATMHIISKYEATDGSRQYSLVYADSSNVFQCNISANGTTYTPAYGTTGISYGSWMHLACVYNDTDIRLYINGVLNSNCNGEESCYNPAAHTAGIYAGNEEFRIGASDDSSYFDGLIDEVIVLNRALSAAEISNLFNDGIDGERGAND